MITSACGDISSRTSSQGKPAGGARGSGTFPPAFASAIAARRRRAAPSAGCLARHSACDAFRRFAWHSVFVHAHCRLITRASGWNRQRQYGQRFRGRILPLCLAYAHGGPLLAPTALGPFAAAMGAPASRRWQSGFAIKQSRGPRKWAFGAEQGDRSGEVKLHAPRVQRSASYQWQRSTDGTAWVDLPSTNSASAVDAGLSPGTLYFFRYRALVGNVVGDWSDPVTFRVA